MYIYIQIHVRTHSMIVPICFPGTTPRQGEMRELAKLVGFDGGDDEWSQVGLKDLVLFFFG